LFASGWLPGIFAGRKGRRKEGIKRSGKRRRRYYSLFNRKNSTLVRFGTSRAMGALVGRLMLRNKKLYYMAT